MRNKRAFQSKQDMTEFSSAVLMRIDREGKASVKLRDGSMRDVIYGKEEQCFHTEEWGFAWNNDGSSAKSHDLDITDLIDFEPNLNQNYL